MARILIADDNDIIRETLKAILKANGHDVAEAINGLDALNQINDAAFDLIILDILMPEKDGLEMLRELRMTHPRTQLIAITGGGLGPSSDYLELARALGAHQTVEKPFKIEQILEAVENGLNAYTL